MAIPSSESIRSESPMVTERAVMPADLFRAAISGNSCVLIQRLQLLTRELQEMKVTIEDSHSTPEEITTKNHTVQSELQTATRFGDTILHLLITKGHNELALKVFQRDMSLLKAQNNMLETPLYCAAKVGNKVVIHNLTQSDDQVVVKGALEIENKNGDTAMHVAAKHGHGDIGRMLMKLDVNVAYKVNHKMEYPLYMAIIEGHTEMVQTMLEVDPNLACTPFSDGMFPIHEAARKGNVDLIEHFIKKYRNDAELQDPYGRNLFHIAAEENEEVIFSGVFKDASYRAMIERMNTATNFEGSTPFHVAAEKGHSSIMRAIWENYQVAERVLDKHGYTPFKLSARQVLRTNENIDDDDISTYVANEGDKFTRKWFEDVMAPPSSNVWERTQVVGLGSVLITTVAFAAAFTIPGGYNQDHGTPILGRRYIFRAFILADALAFIQGSISLFALLFTALTNRFDIAIPFATISFVLAASSMIVAFGLGLYVTLAPVCHPIAVLVLVITVILGSPIGLYLILFTQMFLIARPGSFAFIGEIIASIVVSFLIIFCLAFL